MKLKKIAIAVALLSVVSVLVLIKDPNAQQDEALGAMYDNVIVKNAQSAVSQCHNWQQTLAAAQPGARSSAIDAGFKDLILRWKAVEATYIAGDLDQDAIDYPRYLDIFHVGNESITEQMDKVLKSSSAPKTALYKHSYKTVNALEAVLYGADDLSERRLAIAKGISDNICERLGDIANVYETNRDNFLSARDNALSMLANVLANQTLGLKDWRIGDVAGLTKKYLNQPDPRRAEYFLSHLSLAAIGEILHTQSQLISPQAFPNFVEIADIYGAQKPLEQAQSQLAQAQAEVAKLNKSEFDFDQQQSKLLYQVVGKLQSSYYNSLIQALPVMAKILEADGD
ncbi:imelysin family protein [Pasteurellaceae bacterium TAE3-ERU1]|nr:imelysin family protein [Pasteurellaceae bacterium TAE3-ERU1]